MPESASPKKCVQELAGDGDEVPDRYLWKDALNQPIDVSPPFADIPVIDLRSLNSCSAAITAAELEKLRSALSSWGCIQVINHGIELSVLDEVRELATEFFQLPKEEKQKHARPAGDLEGYGTDMVLYENQTLDWTDRLYLLVTPHDLRKLQFWPQNPKCFRETLEEYTTGIMTIIDVLLRSAAKSLDIKEDSFKDKCGGRPIMYSRFNLYPPCPRPDSVLGLKPHADGSAITVLLPDKEVEGLQVQKDKQWFRVPIIPHALLINLGDQLEILSNGIFKSPMHRVVSNSEKQRISIAMFWAPEVGKEIGPVEGLVDEKRPKLFKSVTDFPELFFKYYQQGKRAIDAVRM